MSTEVARPGDERRPHAPRGRRRASALGCLVALIGATAVGVVRSEVGEAAVPALSAASVDVAEAAAALHSQAIANGNVDVVVRLAVEPDASPERVSEAARQLVDAVKPASPNVTVLDRLGVVSLRADAADVDQLANSSLVQRLEGDAWLAPALNETTKQIGAPSAWASGVRGAGYAVAILDSGVDGNHPALRNKVVYEACFTNGSCPNGQTSQIARGAARPCAGADGVVLTGCEHGTHVAGVIASGDGTYTGVAPDASLVAVQVFSQATGATCGGAPSCPRARTSDVLAALNHLVDVAKDRSLTGGRPLIAANLSLSSDSTTNNCDDSVLKSAVDNLWRSGVATIVAAGNSSDQTKLGTPACISTTVSVGAVDKADAFWPISNASPTLDLLAPGVSVTSTWPGSGGVWGFRPASGTSTAAPHVAGAWAVVAQGLSTTDPAAILNWLQSNGKATTVNSSINAKRIALSNLRREFIQTASLNVTGDMTAIVGDYDGNGSSDIFWFDPTGAQSQLWWYGGGAYTVQRSAMGGVWRPVAGDFNRDGIDDMFWYSPYLQSWFWWGQRNRNFIGDGPYSPYGNYTPVAGDFNGDGSDDIELYGKDGGPSYYYWMGPDFTRPGTGKLIGFGNAPPPGAGYTPIAGDLDGNGVDDILWTRPGSALTQMYTTGGAWWYGPTATGVYAAAFGRFDALGGDDIIWYTPGVSYLWSGFCCSPSYRAVRIEAGDSTPVVGDFNGDGRDEILFYGKGNRPDFMYRSAL